MQVTDTLKRAPKWAWYTVGGLAIGGVGLRLWKHRTASDGTTPLAGSDGTVSEMGPAPAYGSPGASSSPAGVIVPPVIIPQQNTDSGAGMFNDVMGGVLGALGVVNDTVSDVWAPAQQNQTQLLPQLVGTISNIAENAQAGSAPAPAAQNPTPIIVNVPAPAQPPAPAPPTAKKPDPCTGDYPNQSSDGKCYKVVCASGKGDHAKGRWHFYKPGSGKADQHVSATC